jgi:exonuclease III
LFDHIWLSDALVDNKVEAWIDRRTTLTGDGSDHDPAWVVLDV